MKRYSTLSRVPELAQLDDGKASGHSDVQQSAANRALRDDLDLDLPGILLVLWRRKRWIAWSIVLSLTIAVLVCILMKPQFVATSRLQLLSQEMGRLSLGDPGSNSGTDALDAYSTLQTYVTVLQSDTLAMQIIHELRLMDIREFQYSPLFRTAFTQRTLSEPFERSAVKRAVALNRFHSHLRVELLPGTRLLAISYTDTNPELAAAIVNRLVSDFVEYNFQVRYDATTKGISLLTQQMVKLKSEVDISEARAVALQKASGLFGADQQHNIIVDKLDQLNKDLIAAQQNRVAKEVVYKLAQTGNPELVANLLGNPSGSTTSGSSSQNAPLITLLRQQEANLNLEYADAASKYGSAYPKMMELSERRAAVHASIEAELGHLAERAKSEFQVAEAQEEAAQEAFQEQKLLSGKMNDQLIDYMAAKSEADGSRQIYDHLLQKLNEAGVLAGLRSSEFNILDAAEVPGRPAKPNKRLYLGLAALIGVALGLLVAFISEAMDRRIRRPEEIETKIRRPVLGVIPISAVTPSPRHSSLPGASLLLKLNEETPASPIPLDRPASEAFRAFRTRLLLSSPQRPLKVLLVTSALQGDGKSFTSLNLAKAFAQNRGKVLLVDADLRQARLTRDLHHTGRCGLQNVLSGTPPSDCYRMVDSIPGLTFLPAGPTVEDSNAEILGSKAMIDLIRRWRQEFTHIVIDSPPLLAVSDAVVLSTLADGVVLLARYAYTDIRSLQRAARLLEDVNAGCLGVLFNAMDIESAEYERYSGPRTYAYPEARLATGVLSRPREGDSA